MSCVLALLYIWWVPSGYSPLFTGSAAPIVCITTVHGGVARSRLAFLGWRQWNQAEYFLHRCHHMSILQNEQNKPFSGVFSKEGRIPNQRKPHVFTYRFLSNPWSIHATIFTFYMVLPGVASSWCSISPKQHVRRSTPRLPAPIRGSDHNRSRYATDRPLWTSCEPTTPGTVMLATWRGNWHGGFLKWRYPNSWMVYKGNSHYIKWMTWGFPYFRKP